MKDIMKTKLQHSLIVLSLVVLMVLVGSTPAMAQSSRADELAAKQAKKAAMLAPYKPNKAEQWIKKIEGWGLLTAPKGLYPYFGSAYPGGGFAFGAGYRGYYSDTGFWDVRGAYTFAAYRMLDATFRLPDMASGTIKSRFNAHYVYAGKVAFFGVGNDTSQDDEASYLYNPTLLDYSLAFHPGKYFSVGGNVAYEKYEIGSGDKPNVPSIEEIYNPVTAPGLGTNPEYAVAGLFAKFDWRQSPGYTTSGGLYSVEWQKYTERNDLNLDFQRMDVEARQFIPILRANQVIALRALGTFTDVKDQDEIPFFLLPKLGGGSELRGFRDFRFVDRYRMLLTAEYRWTPSKFMDAVLFYETGKVASRSEDLDFSDLHNCWGFGIRFHTPAAVPLRIEIARSVEGTRIIFGGGTSF